MLLSFIALFLICATRLTAQPDPDERAVTEPLSLQTGGTLIEGYVDWNKNELIVYGDAVAPEQITNPAQRRLLGFRAAKAIAYRNLLEMIGQVQVDSETRVENYVLASDSVRVRAQGLVRGAIVLAGSQIENEGLYRIGLRLPLLGGFADVVLPEVPPIDPRSNEPTLPAPLASPIDLLALEDSLFTEPIEEEVVFVPQEPYTGVLVDARGLGLQPSMSPRILSENGRVIYGAATIDRSYAVRYGIVGYANDIDRAVTGDRLGGERANPFVVQATGVSGLYAADVVLGDFDATRVLVADTDYDFLRECRVIFVLGPKPVSFEGLYSDTTFTDNTIISEVEELELQGETTPGDQPQ